MSRQSDINFWWTVPLDRLLIPVDKPECLCAFKEPTQVWGADAMTY